MNPGLVVKLRPTGPWRIGPDSGARNRVDAIYHSDSLYSRGHLRHGAAGLARGVAGRHRAQRRVRRCASAPASRSWTRSASWFRRAPSGRPRRRRLMSARVRWKSARFVPLGMVQAMLAGQRLDENQWSVDGASECLVPAGRPGPFRTGVRWSAAVDRLTRRRRAPLHGLHRIPPRRRPVDRRLVSGRCRARPLAGSGEGRLPPAGRYRLRRRALPRLGPLRSARVHRRHAAGHDRACQRRKRRVEELPHRAARAEPDRTHRSRDGALGRAAVRRSEAAGGANCRRDLEPAPIGSRARGSRLPTRPRAGARRRAGPEPEAPSPAEPALPPATRTRT